MRNYPAEYYATEKNPISLVGYTASLVLMTAGIAQLVVAGVALAKGDATKFDLVLGPGVVVCGGVAAYGYLKDAGVVY
jgi:hypothetical protein|tara:strand:+ start:335 stop:568 length:234 start_codon:yes stop_codon:yes gene_type:complete